MLREAEMNREEFLYRMKYFNWREVLTVKFKKHQLTLRTLIDEGGSLHPIDKSLRYDVIIDGVIGPDARSILKLNEVMRRNFKGIILEMWRHMWIYLSLRWSYA